MFCFKLNQSLLLQIKSKICRTFSKKQCIIILIFYSVCIIFIVSCIKDKFDINKPENCTVQSSKILDIERNFSQNADRHLRMFLNDTVISNIESPQKWTLMATNIYVYSAFYEECPLELPLSSQYCVKFIGIVLSNSSSISPFVSNTKCALKNESFIYRENFAIIEILPENHQLVFTAAFLFCPVPKNIHATHASVYHQSFNITWLQIENQNKHISNHYKFNSLNTDSILPDHSQGINLCVRPIYNSFIAVKFSEFLVYYSVMGVDHFIFYYVKAFKPLQMFLKFLNFSNISSDVFLWDLPLDNDLIHEYGQIAFIQDCIARSKKQFKHTIIVDFDEYIVPKLHKDIKMLVSHLDAQNTYAGSYVIPMSLFCDEYPHKNSVLFPYHILNFRQRQKSHWLHQYRSKFILQPDRVRYSGIHFTWKFEDNYREIYVSPNVALLNHYRRCCGVAQTWFFHLFQFYVLNDDVVWDNNLANFKSKILNHTLLQFFLNIP